MAKWIILKKEKEIEIKSFQDFEDIVIINDKIYGEGNWEIRRL